MRSHVQKPRAARSAPRLRVRVAAVAAALVGDGQPAGPVARVLRWAGPRRCLPGSQPRLLWEALGPERSRQPGTQRRCSGGEQQRGPVSHARMSGPDAPGRARQGLLGYAPRCRLGRAMTSQESGLSEKGRSSASPSSAACAGAAAGSTRSGCTLRRARRSAAAAPAGAAAAAAAAGSAVTATVGAAPPLAASSAACCAALSLPAREPPVPRCSAASPSR